MDISIRMGERIRNIILAAIVAIVAAAVYSPTLRNGFVYDDTTIVRDNPNIRTAANIPKLLTKEYFQVSGERTYRPVNTLSYMLDWMAWKENPKGYHLTNLLLHALNCVLLFLLFNAAGGAWAGFFGALIFAVHPLNTEAVSPVTFREDVMALTAVAGGLLIYSRLAAGRMGRAAACAALAAVTLLGLGCKETAAALPPAVLLYEALFIRGVAIMQRAARVLPALAAMSAACALFLAAYAGFSGTLKPAEAKAPAATGAGTAKLALKSFATYTGLAVYPEKLCADYIGANDAKPEGGLTESLPAAVFVVTLALAAVCARSFPGVTFGLLFFILALLPVSNIIPFGAVFAERYAYVPMAGMCFAVSSLFFGGRAEEDAGGGGEDKVSRAVYAAFLLGVCVIFGVQARGRSAVWRDGATLWRDTVNCCEKSPRANTNLGIALLQNGNSTAAIQYLEMAARLDPKNYEAFTALGAAYHKEKLYFMAINSYTHALKLNPGLKYIHYNIGLVYSDAGRYESAERSLEKALSLDPDYPEALFTLANVYVKELKLREAEPMLLRALKLQPGNRSALGTLGILYMRTGRTAEAEKIFNGMLAGMAQNDPLAPVVKENLKIIELRKNKKSD